MMVREERRALGEKVDQLLKRKRIFLIQQRKICKNEELFLIPKENMQRRRNFPPFNRKICKN
jgi:hypothetical protein